MKISRKALLAALVMTTASFAAVAEQGAKATVSGWVIDSACAFTKGLGKPIGKQCAVACAKKGSPLVIMQDDGTIFLPVSDKTPATAQNQKLLPYAGQHVTVTGKQYMRAGSRALVIETISRNK
jgi:hypothetical protein